MARRCPFVRDIISNLFATEMSKMKDSVSAFLEIISYVIGIIVFVSGVCWMIIRGKVREDIHKIWSDRMTAYEDDKEEEKELRRQLILIEITAIKVSLANHEANAKIDRDEMIKLLDSIKLELINNSKSQINHESRLISLEKRR